MSSLGASPRGTQGKRSVRPQWLVSRPSAKALMTPIASPSSASEHGRRPRQRNAESPRPMPQTVRGPNIWFKVANSDAVTVQSRVPGLVTMGPTFIVVVAARICAWMT